MNKLRTLYLLAISLCLVSCSCFVSDISSLSKGIKYTVRHQKEIVAQYDETGIQTNLGTNNSPKYETFEKEELMGEPDTETKAVSKVYEGFIAQPFTQKKVLPDGTTEVLIKYNRIESTIKFDIAGGFWDYDSTKSDSSEKSFTRKYGSSLPSIDFSKIGKKNYEFAGWKTSADTVINEIPMIFTDKNITYTAQWNQVSGVKYSIHYYFEKADSSDSEDFTAYEHIEDYNEEQCADAAGDETAVHYDATSSENEVITRKITGFILAKEIEQQVVEADGSTVVKVFYKRNPVTVTIALDDGMWNYAEWKADKDNVTPDQTDRVYNGKFGAAFDLSEVAGAGKISSKVSKWLINDTSDYIESLPVEYPAETVKYTAVWENLPAAEYKVEHWYEKLDSTDSDLETSDNYKLDEENIQTLTGLPEADTIAVAAPKAGFTAKTITQKEISADNNTVIKIYYTRNTVKVTIKTGEGGQWNYEGKLSESDDIVFEGKFETPIDTSKIKATRKSYKYVEWLINDTEDTVQTLPSTIPSVDVIYTIDWIDADAATYTVYHWFEKVDALNKEIESEDNYEKDDEKTKIGNGRAETLTDAKVNGKTGFTNRPFTQPEIAADGSTVVNIYYVRNSVTITLNSGDGFWNYAENKANPETTSADTTDKTVTTEFGRSPDYSFVEYLGKKSSVIDYWRNETTGEEGELPSEMPAEAVTYTAVWKNAPKAKYTVEHWCEKADVTPVEYELVEAETETNLEGLPEAMTEAVDKPFAGFTVDSIQQVEIKADNSSVAKVYYNRNLVNLTLSVGEGSWNYKAWKADQKKPDDQKLNILEEKDDIIISKKYGSTIDYSVISGAGKKSSKINNWKVGDTDSYVSELPETMPLEAVTYTAQWVPVTAVNYSVEHWFEKLDCVDISDETEVGYEKRDVYTDTLSGLPEAMTTAAAKTLVGYSSKEVKQIEIEADGSTVVKIFYVRNAIDLTFNADEGLWNYDLWKADKDHVKQDSAQKIITGKYGKNISYSQISGLKKIGKQLIGYSDGTTTYTLDELPAQFTANATYTAVWTTKAAVKYTVKHMIEKLDSTNADDVSNYEVESIDDTNTGIPEYYTEAVAKSITGFEPKEIIQLEIAESGETVVNIYYKRSIHLITFVPNSGIWNHAEWKADYSKADDDPTKENIEPISDPIVISGKYGTGVTLPDALATLGKTNYSIKNWKDSKTNTYVKDSSLFYTTFQEVDVTYTVYWTKKEGINYTVSHDLQKVNLSGYDEKKYSDTNAGSAGDKTEAMPRSIEGFEPVLPIEQQTINEDGSSVVHILYNRIKSKFIFDAAGGTIDGAETKEFENVYQATFNYKETPKPVRSGWTFAGWKRDDVIVTNENNQLVSKKYEAEDVTYTAHWVATVSLNAPTVTGDVALNIDDTGSAFNCSVTIPAGETNQWSFKWYVNGVYVADGSTYNRSYTALGIGKKTITVRAVYNKNIYTAQKTVEIQ